MSLLNTVKMQLAEVKTAYEFVHLKTAHQRRTLWEKIRKLTTFSTRYEEAWVGNWVEHIDLYWDDFDPRQEEAHSKTEKQIKDHLLQESNISLDQIRAELPQVSKRFFELREKVLTELSILDGAESFKGEGTLLKEIEAFQWGMNPGDYIRSRRPQQILTDDPFFLNRGLITPPHIAVGEEIVFTTSLLISYDKFDTLVKRLIRQLEIKTTSAIDENATKSEQQQPVYTIIERFHLVIQQLQRRHDRRAALTITDEYDVQDLMHALLRLHYEDIRVEEYTPSYAGGSSRMDFLLKREKIVVEVKKTRPTLRAREIGEELTVDIVRYRSHPDCKRLICFIYDPDHFVSNPRGVEDDLRRQSSGEMEVDVFIRS